VNRTKQNVNSADKNVLSSKSTTTYLLTMFPIGKGGHTFNGNDEEEWEIQKDTDTVFVVYGML